jgi:hypothetical protein
MTCRQETAARAILNGRQEHSMQAQDWAAVEWKQREICKRYGSQFVASPMDLKVGISENAKQGLVEATFSLRRDAKSSRYEKKVTFDFSKVTDEEIHLMALYAAKVKLQALLRNLSPEIMLNSETLAAVDVKVDLLEADKVQADPVTAAVRSIQKVVPLGVV